MENFQLTEKLKLLPDQPGVYLHKDDAGNVLYVGKAKVLKNRVRSYFNPSANHDVRIADMVQQIRDTEWIVVHTEAEALILEDQLIKLHAPKYNVRLRDDKSYPYLKLSVQELYPRLTLTRDIKKDGSLYFGPFVAALEARKTMKVIHKYFPLRQRNLKLDGSKTYRPCLNYQMKRCLGPCAGYISPEDYKAQLVDKVVHLLKGHYDVLIEELNREMMEKSEKLQFEDAARIRDQVNAVRQTLKKQQRFSQADINRDLFYIIRKGGFAGVQVFFIRSGVLIGRDFFFIQDGSDFNDEDLLRAGMSKVYLHQSGVLPDEILLPFESDLGEFISQFLEEKKSSRVKILTPQRGERKSQLDMVKKNAEENLKLHLEGNRADQLIMEEVQKVLHLKNLPSRVECYDISNTSGVHSVASQVVWENNRASKKDYRHYKIKTVIGPDDFASMEEVLTRRAAKAESGDMPWPDLLVVDGGKGQLTMAVKVLKEKGGENLLKKMDLIGLAKGRSDKKAGKSSLDMDFEYVVKPGQVNMIRLKKHSSTLHFLQRIRDEAHRFAITHHRKVREKSSLGSSLEKITGIGPQKRKNLLKSFGSIQAIKTADQEQLKKVTGISEKDAVNIYQFFH